MNNTKFEQAIKDRLINGFKNLNGGYDAWLEWCSTLYEPDAHYNVGTKRWTLQEYKDAMGEPTAPCPNRPIPTGHRYIYTELFGYGSTCNAYPYNLSRAGRQRCVVTLRETEKR